MCIAIAKKAGSIIKEEYLYNSYLNNEDGCGMAWIDEHGKIQTFKSLTYPEFLAKFKEVEEQYGATSDMLIHFRIKTHGQVDIANCHPFVINDKSAFIHNGTIKEVSVCKDKSDTRMFNEEVLQFLPEGWETNVGIIKMMESFIGWSKLCILNVDTGLHIINEKKGSWDEGIWYSNDSHKRKPYKSSDYSGTNTGSGRAGSYGEWGDWAIPVKIVAPDKALSTDVRNGNTTDTTGGTFEYQQCCMCRQYDAVDMLMLNIDKKDVDEYFCIDCLEHLYEPEDMIVTDQNIEMTVVEYLEATGLFTENEILEYVARAAEHAHDMAVAADLAAHGLTTDKEEDDEESQTAAV